MKSFFILIEEKINLVFNIEPVLCSFFLESKETAYPELPQRDLKSMFLLNTKISWNPIDTDYICFGPYMSANYLNPFNISESLVSSGLEFSLFMPIYDDIYIPKILSIETGFLFSNDNKKNQYYFYGKLSFNLGIIIACKSIQAQSKSINFENLEAADFGSTKLIFCLNYPGYDKVPIVKMNFSDKDFYFVVDTGSTVNTFNRNGINKIMSYENYKRIVETLLEKRSY